MEDDEYEMKDFTYYARIVMMIVLAIQLILFIVFIVVIYGVESDMDKLIFNLSKISLFRYKNLDEMEDDFIFKSEQKQGIETCISFFIISFVVFLVEFIMHFACEKKKYKYDCSEKLFRNWNHLITMLTFVLGQFLYIIACLIIPIYLHRMRTLYDFLDDDLKILNKENKDLIDSSIGRYAVCVVISFVFLVIFIFLYFIIMNLYKGFCCNMIDICRNTNRCMDSFFNCFIDNVNCFFQGCKAKSDDIIKANEEISETEKKYREVTCKIQNAMRRNMELRIKNNDLL
jgi:hypothetical protein